MSIIILSLSILSVYSSTLFAYMSFDTIRIGKRYKLINFGESFEFTAERRIGNGEYLLKDIYTLETYQLKDLIKFGKGKDFDFFQIDDL